MPNQPLKSGFVIFQKLDLRVRPVDNGVNFSEKFSTHLFFGFEMLIFSIEKNSAKIQKQFCGRVLSSKLSELASWYFNKRFNINIKYAISIRLIVQI